MGDLVDIMAGTGTADDPVSDDEVEVPSSLVNICTAAQPTKWVPKCFKFRGLNSILCSYKLDEVNPKDPK